MNRFHGQSGVGKGPGEAGSRAHEAHDLPLRVTSPPWVTSPRG